MADRVDCLLQKALQSLARTSVTSWSGDCFRALAGRFLDQQTVETRQDE